MLSGLFVVSGTRVKHGMDTRLSDIGHGHNTPTLILSQKHVKFPNYCRARYYNPGNIGRMEGK